MTPFEIPLQPSAQKMSIVLNNVTYSLTLKWNVFMACWVMDLADANEEPILTGIPLVTGCDLLEQFFYLDFGGALVVQTDYEQDAIPTFTSLGSTGHLYFVTP